MATQADNWLLVDIAGTELTAEDRRILCHPKVLGIILFTRNFVDIQQLQRLTTEIRQLPKPLLITVDQEGGRVQRFRNGFTQLPALQALRNLRNFSPNSENKSLTEAEIWEFTQHWTREAGWQMAQEMLAMGIDLSFAPVLDLGNECQAIGDRSFSAFQEEVYTLGKNFILGMQEAGMASVGKHFPGHGAVLADSHLETPVDHRPAEVIFKQDMEIFTKLISNNYLQGIMPAHVIYSQINPNPACGSSFWLKEVLRQQLHFQGVVFSDDLNMKGAEMLGDYPSRCQQAFDAGCDVILLCNNRPAVQEVLADCNLLEYDQQRLARINALFAKNLNHWESLQKSPRYLRNLEFLSYLQNQWLLAKANSATDPTKPLADKD